MVEPLDGEVEQVVDHQRLGVASLEPAGVDHSGDHHLDGVDAADPSHLDEDPVPSEEFDDETLDSRRPTIGSTLHDDIAHLAHLVACAVQDRQAPDARDEDRGRRCRSHASIITGPDGLTV